MFIDLYIILCMDLEVDSYLICDSLHPGFALACFLLNILWRVDTDVERGLLPNQVVRCGREERTLAH
jgi:hypothetical protein